MKAALPCAVSLLSLLVLAVPAPAGPPMRLLNESRTISRLAGTEAVLEGFSELHIADAFDPLGGGRADLKSGDVWLFLDSVRPAAAASLLAGRMTVKGAPVEAGVNARVVQYLDGTVVIPHGPDYLPLELFTEPGLEGEALKPGLHDYHRLPGTLDQTGGRVGSLRLKRGYMATLATKPDGSGFSKVFVAQDADLKVCRLPQGFGGRVAFVRVIPWRWTAKKGWCGGWVPEMTVSWRYDWNNVADSTPDTEYVPMRHNKNWNAYENVNSKRDSTHVLAFNEPERADQAKMTVDEALEQWPRLLESGLRLGSPAPSDGGLGWLYEFIDRADTLGYRVDFVAVHYYRPSSAEAYRQWLEAIHKRTGRPIWITEFNNGANWTPPEPTREENARKIREFIEMLDAAPFVERYAVYNWVQKGREMISNWKPVEFTEGGGFYRDRRSPMAYRDPGPVPLAPAGLSALALSGMRVDLSWRDVSDNEAGFRIERKEPGGEFARIATTGPGGTGYSDRALASKTEYRYRVRAYNPAGESEEAGEVSVGTLPGVGVFRRAGWKVVRADSEELEAAANGASCALDGNPSTVWHTRWTGGSPKHPHTLEVDLGGKRLVSGLRCLPRQDGNPNGMIAGYTAYLSADGRDWGKPVAAGTWGKDFGEKEVLFAPTKARYLRLVAESEVNGGDWASLAELNLLGE